MKRRVWSRNAFMKRSVYLLALWFLLVAHAALAEPPVKKSTSGICHDSLSPSYNATKHFEAFETLDACIQSGGRLPKNRAHTPKRLESKDTSAAKHQAPVPSADRDNRVARAWPTVTIMAWTGAGVFGLSLGIYLLRSRNRLESSDDDIFKRRYYRWDPWLKRIGYFDKDKKK